jgi:hypothetical protein
MKKADQLVVNEWKGKIAGNQNWAFRAAVRMVELQTEEEKNVGATLSSNGVGLNAFDAEIVTNIVKWHQQHGRLTKKQSDALRRIMPKYAAQLFRIVNDSNKKDEKPAGG